MIDKIGLCFGEYVHPLKNSFHHFQIFVRQNLAIKVCIETWNLEITTFVMFQCKEACVVLKVIKVMLTFIEIQHFSNKITTLYTSIVPFLMSSCHFLFHYTGQFYNTKPFGL